MAYDILIVNGQVVTATETLRADVAIVGDKVVEVAPNLRREGVGTLLDAAGNYVLPGGVDVHTHIDMPLTDTISSSDDFETGTRAAAFGGTTTVVDYAAQSRGQSLKEAIELWKAKARGKAVIDYGFHCIITDLTDSVIHETDELVAEGVSSFKVFMAYPGRLMLDDGAIFRLLQRSAVNGSLVCVHAENGGAIDVLVKQAVAAGNTEPKYHALTRPTIAEAEATGRAIALAEMADASVYIAHVSCQRALDQIEQGRMRGLPVMGETCPQYLFLSLENFDVPAWEGAKYVLTPPLREKWNQAKLWDGLASGALQVVSTDHCPFNFRGQKDFAGNNFTRIPNGGPGIENRLSLIFTGGVLSGRFSVNRFVDLVSTTPARIFGMYPRKGTIAAGSDADLVIFNPHRQYTITANSHHMRVDYSLYEGLSVTGVPEVVLSRGRIIVRSGAFEGVAGSGEFLSRSPSTALRQTTHG